MPEVDDTSPWDDNSLMADATPTIYSILADTTNVSTQQRVHSDVSTHELSMSTVEALAFVGLTTVCIAFAVVGNVLVILSIFTYRPLRDAQNAFVVSLACADLAVTVFVMPFNVANYVQGFWGFGSVWCSAWLTLDVLTCTASILNLCAIAVDRYRVCILFGANSQNCANNAP
jgi:hypothetical protein